jgi:hypothetical protein
VGQVGRLCVGQVEAHVGVDHHVGAHVAGVGHPIGPLGLVAGHVAAQTGPPVVQMVGQIVGRQAGPRTRSQGARQGSAGAGGPVGSLAAAAVGAGWHLGVLLLTA